MATRNVFGSSHEESASVWTTVCFNLQHTGWTTDQLHETNGMQPRDVQAERINIDPSRYCNMSTLPGLPISHAQFLNIA